jgi:hypothetical protein
MFVPCRIVRYKKIPCRQPRKVTCKRTFTSLTDSLITTHVQRLKNLRAEFSSAVAHVQRYSTAYTCGCDTCCHSPQAPGIIGKDNTFVTKERDCEMSRAVRGRVFFRLPVKCTQRKFRVSLQRVQCVRLNPVPLFSKVPYRYRCPLPGSKVRRAGDLNFTTLHCLRRNDPCRK